MRMMRSRICRGSQGHALSSGGTHARHQPSDTRKDGPGQAEWSRGICQLLPVKADMATGSFCHLPRMPFRLMRARFYRVMPPRRANVLGFVTIAAFLVIVTRDGLFDRVVLIVASPTGTGWLDPGSHDPVEYMHGGDIATVAAQYSYL